jgi:hypothetical protein
MQFALDMYDLLDAVEAMEVAAATAEESNPLS